MIDPGRRGGPHSRQVMAEEIARKAERKLAADRRRDKSILFGLGMLGLVGWSVAVPTLVGVAIGVWLDRLFPGQLAAAHSGLAPGRCSPSSASSLIWRSSTSAFIAAGYADYALIAFHLDKSGLVPPTWIPLLYAIAMASDAVAALAVGRAFDRVGLSTMVIAAVASAASAPLVFLGDLRLVAIGMALWGMGVGAQESVMRAAVAVMAPKGRRGTAFGTMNMIYGVAWLGGSALLGILYDQTSALWVALVSAALQLTSLPVFVLLTRRQARTGI